MWTLILNPLPILQQQGGQASRSRPTWLKKGSYLHTWTTHSDDLGSLNCASFCLANWLNDGGRGTYHEYPHVRFSPPSSAAFETTRRLHNRLGFGGHVSMLDLQAFTNLFSMFRLTLVRLHKPAPEASFVVVHEGADYDPNLTNMDCVMILFEDHWALTTSLNAVLRQIKNGGAYRYCSTCKDCLNCRFEGYKVPSYPAAILGLSRG